MDAAESGWSSITSSHPVGRVGAASSSPLAADQAFLVSQHFVLSFVLQNTPKFTKTFWCFRACGMEVEELSSRRGPGSLSQSPQSTSDQGLAYSPLIEHRAVMIMRSASRRRARGAFSVTGWVQSSSSAGGLGRFLGIITQSPVFQEPRLASTSQSV